MNYWPGMGIPICSDDDLFALPDKSIPLLNFIWHIPREIHNYLTVQGYTSPIIDILGTEGFG